MPTRGFEQAAWSPCIWACRTNISVNNVCSALLLIIVGGNCHQQVLLRHDAREPRSTGQESQRHDGESVLQREDSDVHEHAHDPREAPPPEETQDRRAVLLPVSLGIAGGVAILINLSHEIQVLSDSNRVVMTQAIIISQKL